MKICKSCGKKHEDHYIDLCKRCYMRKYMKNRYHSDPEFRQHMIGLVRNWQIIKEATDPIWKEKERIRKLKYGRKLTREHHNRIEKKEIRESNNKSKDFHNKKI